MSGKEFTLETLLNDRRMQMVTKNAAQYGVSAAVIDYGAGSDLASGGYYIVAGLGHFPDISANGVTPKSIEKQSARNENLFYPKAFAQEISADNTDTVIDDLTLYCQRAEIIAALYREHNCEIPDVMCFGEMSNLISFNDSASNPAYDYVLRGEYLRLIDRFFENEAKIARSRGHRERMEYVRSDRYNGPLDRFRKDLSYYRLKGKQEIPLPLLQHVVPPHEGDTLVTDTKGFRRVMAPAPVRDAVRAVDEQAVQPRGRQQEWKLSKPRIAPP